MTARPSGFALLIVLWTMVLLALFVSEITAAGRTDAQLAANQRGSAVAEAAADGAYSIALFHYLDDGSSHWAADGTWHRLRLGDAAVTVAITDDDGRINPNTAPGVLLVALLRRLGVDPAAAGHLAAAIVDWRTPGTTPSPHGAKAPQYRAAGLAWGPPGAPFQSTGELALVLGMTPALVTDLRPHLSVFTTGEVDPARADPIVQAALADVNGGMLPPPYASPTPTLRLTAAAAVPGGARFSRVAIVRVDPATGAITRLAWEQGDG